MILFGHVLIHRKELERLKAERAYAMSLCEHFMARVKGEQSSLSENVRLAAELERAEARLAEQGESV